MYSKTILKLLIPVVLTLSPAAQALQCSLPDFKSLCAQLPQSEEPYIKLSDGRLMVNPHRKDDTLPTFTPQQLKEGRQNIQNQFNEIKGQLSSYLGSLGNSEVIKNLKTRIDAMSLKITNSECKKSLSGGGHYSSVLHAVEVCPYSGLLSKGYVTWLIAHEMSHSIDICNMQSKLFKINGTLPHPPGVSFQNNAFYSAFVGTKYLSNSEHREPDMKPLLAMVDEGVKSGSASVIAQSLSHQQFPMKKLFKCMADKNLFSQDTITPKAGDKCSHGTLSETPSDIWATKIVGMNLQNNSYTKPEDRLGTLSQETTDLLCRPRVEKMTGTYLTELPTKGLPVQGRYINNRFRAELTTLSNPGVQKALGCQPVSQYGNCIANMDDLIRSGLGELPNVMPPPTDTPGSTTEEAER